MSEKTITDELRRTASEMIKKSHFSALLGFELVDLEYGEATLRLPMRDELRQPYGLLHGGATASLIDTAMAYACISCLAKDEKSTTIDLTVHYLRPHTDGAVLCTAKVVRHGRRVLTVSAEAVNEQGKLIATALSTYMKI
ncbi:MAG: PaaI family thioesterase [Acidobacteria bacterium]|nr:PaaI family thioesterase [Acidobacteriota bacterium]